MKKIIAISFLSLVVFYSIAAVHYFLGQWTVSTDLKIIKEATSVDLSTFHMYTEQNGGSKVPTNSLFMFFNTKEREGYQYPINHNEVYYMGNKIDTIEQLIEIIGDDDVRGVSFVDTTSRDGYAYIDKANNKKLLIPNFKGKPYSGGVVNYIDLYDFSDRFRYPVYKNPLLAVFDPFSIHRQGTFYPLIDLLILPFYYFLVILPIIIVRFAESKKIKSIGKVYLAFVALALLSAIIYLVWYFFNVFCRQ